MKRSQKSGVRSSNSKPKIQNSKLPTNPCQAILFHSSMCGHPDGQGHELPHKTSPQSMIFYQEHLPAEGTEVYSLRDQVKALEHRLIQDALVANNGEVAKASLALGFNHPSELKTMIVDAGHADLINLIVFRTPRKTKGVRRGKTSRTRTRN